MPEPVDQDVDLMPLHGTVLAAEKWYACEHPERPVERDRTVIDIGCRACVLMLGAASMAAPGRAVVDIVTDEEVGTYAEMYEQLRGQHGLPELLAVRPNGR